jgi:nucleoside-diphosphate-sugar epimerase
VKKILVIGSSGLIGSEVVSFFSENQWEVHGVDNNMRADFFGPQGDTSWNTTRLEHTLEKQTRWDYSDPEYANGIKETFSIDHSMHSVFGASKVAADVMVQEYGRYFQMPTCCLRGGCLTGPNHSGVELHGFLSYLIRCNLEGRTYNVFGYQGKQVRDNIHSYDVAQFINLFIRNPRQGEVYNVGGGRDNSISILEAFELIAEISGKKDALRVHRPESEGRPHLLHLGRSMACTRLLLQVV